MPSPITLAQYLDAVTAAIGAVPGVGLARCDGVLDETEAGPVVLVHPQGLETLDELGSTEWHATVLLELIVLVKRTTRTSRRDVMDIAIKVAKAARWQQWGLAVQAAEVRGLHRGTFDQGLEPLGEAWEMATIELSQAAVWWVGDEAADPAVVTVWLGRDPDIGIGHEADYVQIVPDGSGP